MHRIDPSQYHVVFCTVQDCPETFDYVHFAEQHFEHILELLEVLLDP